MQQQQGEVTQTEAPWRDVRLPGAAVGQGTECMHKDMEDRQTPGYSCHTCQLYKYLGFKCTKQILCCLMRKLFLDTKPKPQLLC